MLTIPQGSENVKHKYQKFYPAPNPFHLAVSTALPSPQPRRGKALIDPPPGVSYSPLYFFLVAIPPRIWRSALFSLRISLTC